ncbi:hypothetical protein HYW76_02450 [Candidatus Pacearchaeota archaeon]|nr:hypothetical protein [Candidatus Pacearchaeota archaeon]
MANKKSYEEGSIVDLAVKGLNPIKKLLEEDKPVNKLLALNMILVFVCLGILIASYLNTEFKDLASIVMLFISFLFSAIVTGAYAFVLNLIQGHYKVKAVRVSIFVLLIILPLTVISLAFKIPSIANISLILILVQAVILVVLSLMFKDEEVKELGIWGLLGKANTILGIISSIITIGGLIIKFVKW